MHFSTVIAPKLVLKVDLRWPAALHVAVVQEVNALYQFSLQLTLLYRKGVLARCWKTASIPADVVQHGVPGSLLLPLISDNWHCPISMRVGRLCPAATEVTSIKRLNRWMLVRPLWIIWWITPSWFDIAKRKLKWGRPFLVSTIRSARCFCFARPRLSG